MRRKTGFLFYLLRRYYGRLLLVFLFNTVSVLLSIAVFMMIEPFCRLLFRGTLDGLSPVSAFFVSELSRVVDVTAMGQSVAALVVVAILLYLLKNLTGYAAQWVMASVRGDVLYTLRNRLYEKVVHLPLGYFTGRRSGDMVSRAVNDAHDIEYTILGALRSLIVEPVTVLFYIAVLFYIHARLSLYALLLLPVSFLVIGRLSHSLRRDARTSKLRLGDLLSHVEETLAGLRVIKGFNAQGHARRVFDRHNVRFSDQQRKVYRKADLASPLSEFLGVTVVMAVLVIGGIQVLSPTPTLTAELFITYIAMFSQVINPVKSLSTAVASYKRGLSALDRINEVLDAGEEPVAPAQPAPLPPLRQGITLDHVSFAYADKPVLVDACLEIRQGEKVALIGPSGSGKTTVADLIERFYDPTEGAVLLDGTDIRRFDLRQYRALFSVVSQDVVLFHDTVFQNIAMGLKGVTEEQVVRAAKVANIHDFILSLPGGYGHVLADRGLNLSGGQRQRISIARAVLRDTPVLLLDEATSAMDTESEKAVQSALDNAMRNRTVLVIAHRLSTIRNADRVVTLERGEIRM